ncbi:MAG: hypothetical protein ABIZ91_16075 [Gemmatimonadaceae bacterium]
MLVIQTAATQARTEALDAFRARRALLGDTACNYWVFERADAPGTFTQFLEAGDEATLQRACRLALGAHHDDPILREVEL